MCYNKIMKIAIISDTHDNLTNLEKFLVQFAGPASAGGSGEAKGIIHCGDVTTPETLDWLAENFAGPIKLACGNAEIKREEFAGVAKKYQNLEVFLEIGQWEISRGVLDKNVSHPVTNINIAFVHKPDKIEELAKTGKYSFVFYGHTHKPWINQIGSVLVANPGTLGGVFTAPTYATLDTVTGQLALHRL